MYYYVHGSLLIPTIPLEYSIYSGLSWIYVIWIISLLLTCWKITVPYFLLQYAGQATRKRPGLTG